MGMGSRGQRPTTITDLIRATLVVIAALIIGFAPRTNWGATPRTVPTIVPVTRQNSASRANGSQVV